MLYKSQILAQTQETADDNNYKIAINDFEREIPQFNGAIKSVLQSLLANIYQQYEQNTRWQRRSITELDSLPKDIAEWSSKQLLQKSMNLYEESVKNSKILQKEKTEKWKQILTSTEDINLFPTIYDVLTVRYINVLGNNILNYDKENNNKISNLYENLIAFHKDDSDKSAFLNFKLQKIRENENDILALADQYKSEPFSAFLYYCAARIYSDNGDKKRAFEICQNVKFDKNNKWTENAKSLTSEIQMSVVQVYIDEFNLPNTPIAVNVRATNVDKVYYRIYQYKQEINKTNKCIDKNSILYKSGVFELQKFDDFLQHSTIIKLDGLPAGYYKIDLANNPEMKSVKENNQYALNSIEFYVDEWTTVNLENNLFQLLNRRMGEAQANKSISFYNKDANNEFVLKTDENGIFSLTGSKTYHDNTYYLYNPDSKNYLALSGRNFYKSDEKETETHCDFFLDRAIYRPGQTVYFKAILYSKFKNDANIIKNRKVTVDLIDFNGQKISELTLTSNDYGSIFGEFVLPQNGLTGNFALRCLYNYGAIRVEEYKRPKFDVAMDALKGEFVLEKEVKTSGKAESYAGAPISDAKVIYRVERIEIFPYYRWWYPPQPANNETIIQSETTTDENGKFEISFKAIPKNNKEASGYRTYTYTVFADVTDVNGETHSAQQSVTIGDLPKMLTLQIPQKSLQKDFNQITVKSTNLNGVREDSKGKIVVTQLITPNRILLPNKISQSYQYNDYYDDYNQIENFDYQLYDEKTFVQYFPHLPYSADEMNIDKWKRGGVQTFDFDTQKSDSVRINRLSKGFYQIEAYTIYEKDTIRTMQTVEILDDKNLSSADNNFYSVQTEKKSYQVGEQIIISFLSSWEESTAILHIESGNKWIDHKQIPIKNGKGTYVIVATKDFLRDGLFISSYLLKENGYKQVNFAISVADKPRDLKITTKTFRDKIKPGEKQTWELTISGADKDKIAAEVLTTMYDFSLDKFAVNSFNFNPFSYYTYGNLYSSIRLNKYNSLSANLSPQNKSLNYYYPNFIDLQNFSSYGGGMIYRSKASSKMYANSSDVLDEVSEQSSVIDFYGREMKEASDSDHDGVSDVRDEETSKATDNKDDKIQIRSNLQETAFFYPNLYTDEKGDIKFTFTSPEALTKWKLLILAHTQDLQSGTAEFYTQTQKELMVVPNLPRFLREGDEVVISAKINNLSGKDIKGYVSLEMKDDITGEVLPEFVKKNAKDIFIEKGKNAEASFRFSVPKGVNILNYKIIAVSQSNEFSDGEQGVLPVLPNRMLVTETMPIFAKEGQTKTFKLDKLVNNSAASSTLENFNLTLELTTNPLWLAVMSLPYLREYPYECSEQIFSRLYGNVLSTYIVNSNPKIKNVFDNWNKAGHNVSELEQNQELKNILLEETPWVREAQNQTEQRKRLAVLFNLNKMSQEFEATQQKLIKRQNSDGGFAWFDGGQSSPYISGHIVQGFGQLRKMLSNNYDNYINAKMKDLIKKSIQFIDSEQVKAIKKQEAYIKKHGGKIDGKDFIHYYYVRSFWKNEFPLPQEAKKYLDDINKSISEYFTTYDLQRKAMIATTLWRYGFSESAKKIINNLKETSVEADEMGMYWKNNRAGWLWYQSPVEAQSKAIEAFAEISAEKTANIEEMKIWLMKNRQTNAWNSTKATTDAVYSLITFGKDWSNAEEGVNVWVGDKEFVSSGKANNKVSNNIMNSSEFPPKTEVYTNGYIKTSWAGKEISSEKGIVKVQKTSAGTMWGGLFWQYFENLDKITQANSNVKMEKSLFIKKNTDTGQKLIPISSDMQVKIGDLITVRLVINVDRDMEYIHVKDMRAAGFEPVNVSSGYKYQNGCSYYESTRDAATNFFFERMIKGIYVFEYDVRANNAGTFSNGITTLQNMYAPEMSCHSQGIKITIDKEQ
ncbi:MAG: MG2 domain-containing protein [Paludibacter sp.]|nr:MG2 domain-containing protein [Paludibacter sp.]